MPHVQSVDQLRLST